MAAEEDKADAVGPTGFSGKRSCVDKKKKGGNVTLRIICKRIQVDQPKVELRKRKKNNICHIGQFIPFVFVMDPEAGRKYQIL